jgi:hypothetical protein
MERELRVTKRENEEERRIEIERGGVRKREGR